MSLSQLAKTLVQGANDAGVPPAGYPLDVAWDGTNQTRLRTDSNGQLQVITSGGALAAQVEGTTAEGGSIASLRPVLTGISDSSVLRGARQHQVADIASFTGVQAVGLCVRSASGSVSVIGEAQLGDAVAGGNMIPVGVHEYNRNNYDRRRTSSDNTGLASAARTATPTAIAITVYNERFLTVVVDVTAIVDTPSVVLTIDAFDAVSGKWITLLTSAAIVGVSTNTYKVGIGHTAVANLTVNDTLRRSMRVVLTHADADSITYSVGYQLNP